jgi:hypothetical protein
MSKRNESDQPLQDQPDLNPAGENITEDKTDQGGNTPPDNNSGSGNGGDNPEKNSGSNSSNNADEPKLLTIEEHKKNLNIDAPVFAAVMLTKKWASGKKVPEADFKKAVKEFLGAPMDGAEKDVPAVEEHKENPDALPEGGE